MTTPSTVPPEPAAQPLRPLLFYTLAFAIAWLAWLPLLLHQRAVWQIPIPFGIALFVGQTLGAFAPLLALFAIQRIDRDPTLVQRVFARFRFRAVAWWWFVVPALTPIALTALITAGHGLFSGEPIALLRPEPVAELGWGLLAVIPFQFALGMLGSPLGEEPGWRGYIFDGYARKRRSWLGSGIVALLWGVWHWPLFLILEVDLTVFTFLVLAGHSLLIDSFYLLSGRNLLVAMLYHQGINTSFLFFITQTETPVGAAVLALVALGIRARSEGC